MDPEQFPTAQNPPIPPKEDEKDSSEFEFRSDVDPPTIKVDSRFDGPDVGDTLENCLLIAELGSGTSGRAFLAQQPSLAGRLVVLKVSNLLNGEEINLARLQHTNIMPLYWASTAAEHGLHVLAMPYLGRTTLAGLLSGMEEFPRGMWNGQIVFDVLQAEQAEMPAQIAVQGHSVEVLTHSSWIEFVTRLGHILAEALAYAHQRGLLHLDLKPANILITPDGHPILLDLDVARQPIPAGTTSVPWLGGTEYFMSPEQRAAMIAVTLRQPIACDVDGRSDLYSLGLVLYHALGGVCDAQNMPNLNTLMSLNADISQGLVEILARCLAQNPKHRYPDCNALAEDLDRHLHDLPLRGVRNSLSEKWRKWRRRRPFALHVALLFVGFCTAAGAAGFTFQQANEERRRNAEIALTDGQEWQRKGQFEAAVRRYLVGKELAEQTFGAKLLQSQLERRLSQAQRQQKAGELANVVHLMRFYALQEHLPRRLQHVLEASSRNAWADRGLLIDHSAGRLELAAERNIRAHLQELVLLWSDLQVRLAPATHTEPIRREVQKVLKEAEQLFGPSLALGLAQEKYAGIPPARHQPEAAWEFCTLARFALDRNDLANAARFIQEAIQQEPFGFAANFYLGVCMMRLKKFDQALQAFSFCVGQDPFAECILLRGQAQAALGVTDRALSDFSRAIEMKPSLALAYHHRSSLYQSLGRLEEAAKDSQLAKKLSE